MLNEVLARIDPFSSCDPARLRDLAAHCVEVPYAAGRLLFSHGDEADAVFVVLEGTVAVFRDQVGKPLQLLARVGGGELLGELALFDEVRRTATARTATACRIVRIEKAALQRLLVAEPQVALRIQNTAARRRSSNSAAALQLGQQAEVRIRVGATARLRFPDGRLLVVGLENLSVGGVSLSGVPAEWTPGFQVAFDLLADDEPLAVDGRVAWRHERTVGISFASQAPGHERHVYRILRKLTEEPVP